MCIYRGTVESAKFAHLEQLRRPSAVSFLHEISFYNIMLVLKPIAIRFHCTDKGPVEDCVRLVGTDS